MRDDQRKLDKTRARSYRAGPRYLSGEDASVALASNHQGHATGQRNNASASGDRSDGAGVGQRRVRSGGSTGRSVHVADAATSGDGSRAVAGRDLAAGGHAGGANGAGGRASATLIGGGDRRVVGRSRRLSGATGVVVGRGRGLLGAAGVVVGAGVVVSAGVVAGRGRGLRGGGVSGRVRGLLGGGGLGGESDTCRSGDQTERRGGGEQRRGRLLHCFSWNECGEG